MARVEFRLGAVRGIGKQLCGSDRVWSLHCWGCGRKTSEEYMSVLGLLLGGSIVARGLVAVVLGARDGVLRQHIHSRSSDKTLEGMPARRYGWFSVAGGMLYVAMGILILWFALFRVD